jgi:hypothetical protein
VPFVSLVSLGCARKELGQCAGLKTFPQKGLRLERERGQWDMSTVRFGLLTEGNVKRKRGKREEAKRKRRKKRNGEEREVGGNEGKTFSCHHGSSG